MMVRAALFISAFWGLSGFASLSSAALPDFTEIVEASSPAVVKILSRVRGRKPPLSRGTRRAARIPEAIL